MKIAFITGEPTPYRIAFCDSINEYMEKENKGGIKMLMMSEQGFNNAYDNEVLKRPWAEFIKGKTITLPDNTTRFMINWGIGKKVAEEQFDFIVLGGSWTHPSTWLLLWNKKRIKAPIYFWAESHFHNGLKRKQKSWWKEWLKKRVYQYFDGFFIPGQFAKEAIVQTRCRRAEVCEILPNLVENEKYIDACEKRKHKEEMRKQYGIEKEKIVMFTPARLVDLKGIMEFLEYGREQLQDSEIVWVIAGMGPLKEEIESSAAEHNIDVRLTGFLKQDEMIDYLALTDWFLLPSLSDPNPLSVIEALWSGLPIACSVYVGNHPETLIHEKNGLLFDTLDKQSVSDTLKRIKSVDQEWCKKAGEESLAVAREYFDMKVETEKFVKKIERITKN